MGQAKLRGTFAERKQAAISRNAADDAAQRKRVAEERFALNEWRKENPAAAGRERRERLRAQTLIAAAASMGVSMIYADRAHAAQPQPDEQSVFETWLADKCPSGDVAAVQYQWASSSDYKDFLAQGR